jgi:uncharacterized protein HemY
VGGRDADADRPAAPKAARNGSAKPVSETTDGGLAEKLKSLVKSARSFIRAGNLPAARGDLDRIKGLQPAPNVRSLCLEAELAQRAGDHARERSLLEQAIALNKVSPLANKRLGRLLVSSNEIALAKTHALQAMKRGQDDPDVWRLLRDIHLAEKLPEDALSAQEVVVSLLPQQADERQRLNQLKAMAQQ